MLGLDVKELTARIADPRRRFVYLQRQITPAVAADGVPSSAMRTCPIPATDEALPVIGCGTYVGFDVDVAKYVAKKLGYSEDEIVWKESPSKQREAMLQNGDVDYIVASYSITDERKKVVDFAGPYFVAGQDLLVRKDETGIDGVIYSKPGGLKADLLAHKPNLSVLNTEGVIATELTVGTK